MKYLAATSSNLDALHAHPDIGVMIGPRVGGMGSILTGRVWASDCDALNLARYSDDAFFEHLERLRPHHRTSLFITVPDLHGDAESTLAAFEHYGRVLAEFGFPLAYVLQDGAHEFDFPPCDWVFLGGTDDYREAYAALLIERAREEGLRVHVGRVNSERRLKALAVLEADTADGTYLSFKGVERGTHDVGLWLTSANSPKLWHASDLKASSLGIDRVRYMREAFRKSRRTKYGPPTPDQADLFGLPRSA